MEIYAELINESTWKKELLGIKGISAESPYKFKILVGYGARTCVKERLEGNGIPNHQPKGPVEEEKSGSGTG